MCEQSPKTILLVEDEAMIAMLEKTILEKYGYQVIVAYNGEEAVATVESNPAVNLILMDINLGPGIDGTEAAEIILKKYDLPLIFLSSHTEPEVVEKTEGITSYGYIVKDTGETVLIASIKMAFRLFEAKVKQVEHRLALQESDHKFKSITRNAADCIFIKDQARKYIFANQALQNLLALPEEQILGKKISDILDQNQCRMIQELDERTFDGNTVNETLGLNLKNQHYFFNTIQTPLTVENGQVTAIMGIIRDCTSQKQVEEHLRVEKEKAQQYLDTAEVVFVSLDREGVVTLINQKGVAILGYPEEEIIGKNWFDHFIPDQIREQVKNVFYRLMQNEIEPPQYHENPIITKPGEKKILIWRNTILKDNAGRITGTLSCGTDISDIYQTQHEFETFFKLSVDMLCIADINSLTFLKVNPSFNRILGYTEQELLGQPFLNFIHPQDLAQTVDVVEQELKKGKKILKFENRYRTKKGDYRWLVWTSHPMPDKGICYAVAHDITDRKQFESSLNNSVTRLRLLIEQSPFSIALFLPDGKMIYCNQSYMELHHINPHQIQQVYQEYNIFKDEKIITHKIMPYIQKGFAGETTEIPFMKHEFAWQSGQRTEPGQWIKGFIYPLKNLTGQIKEVVIVYEDMTGDRETQAKIDKLILSKDNQLREMHHRIKNNMNTMKSLLTLQEVNEEDGAAKKALKAASKRMNSLILLYDLLTQNQVGSDVFIKDYVSSLVDEITRSLPGKITVIKNLTDFIIPLQMATPLGIIMAELMSNIMKYAFPEVNETENSLEIDLNHDKRHFFLHIKANGRGFNLQEKPKGFGLTLVEGLIKLMNGQFTIEKDEQQKAAKYSLKFDL